MLSGIRKRMTYANVAATLALVFAMSGGALAASHVLIKSLSQISKPVQKQLKTAGKPGATGATGATGPAGTAGAPGPAGAAGEKGLTGAEGKEGPQGKEGSVGAVLPVGKSESGTWVSAGPGTKVLGFSGKEWAPASISFGVPLETAPAVHIITMGTPEANDPEGCSGTVAAPVAEPGNLCIFAKTEVNVLPEEEGEAGYREFPAEGEGLGAGKRGIVFGARAEKEGEPLFAMGVWVVTA